MYPTGLTTLSRVRNHSELCVGGLTGGHNKNCSGPNATINRTALAKTVIFPNDMTYLAHRFKRLSHHDDLPRKDEIRASCVEPSCLVADRDVQGIIAVLRSPAALLFPQSFFRAAS
jgi:hypothetical protein